MTGMRSCQIGPGIRGAIQFAQDQGCMNIVRDATQVRQKVIDEHKEKITLFYLPGYSPELKAMRKVQLLSFET
jgi:hypothetical protein